MVDRNVSDGRTAASKGFRWNQRGLIGDFALLEMLIGMGIQSHLLLLLVSNRQELLGGLRVCQKGGVARRQRAEDKQFNQVSGCNLKIPEV